MRDLSYGRFLWVGALAFFAGCFVVDDFAPPATCFDESLQNTRECLLPNQITAGRDHTCIVRNNGTVWCWGNNESFQLGLKSDFFVEATHIPKQVDKVTEVTQVSAGANHSCAVRGPEVLCWGANERGQAGTEVSDDEGQIVLSPSPVSKLPNIPWKMVSAGGQHTCALSAETEDELPQVWCWGDNQQGQVDASEMEEELFFAAKKKNLGNVVIEKISAGSDHTCAQTSDNIICWGNPRFGKTGRTHENDAFTGQDPKQLIPGWSVGTQILDIATGDSHNCTLIDSGEIYCWGSADDDRLTSPLSMTSTNSTPVKIAENAPMNTVRAGLLHTCTLSVLDSGGEVYCWGGNADFQLGDGSDSSRTQPGKISAPGKRDIVELAVGSKHACALKRTSREILCWGLNEYGQSGQAWDERSMNSQRHVKTPTGFVLPDPIPPMTDAGVDDDTGVGVDTGTQDASMVAATDAEVRDSGDMATDAEIGTDADAGIGTDADAGTIADAEVGVDAGFPDTGVDAGTLADSGTGHVTTMIAVGVDHSCAVRENPHRDDRQHVECWGKSQDPYLAEESRAQERPEFIAVRNSLRDERKERIVDIQAGRDFTCIQTELTASSTKAAGDAVYCWGNAENERLGFKIEDSVDFTRTASGSGNSQVAQDVVVDTDGSSYVVGSFEGTTSFGACGTRTATGTGRDIFLARYSAQGNCEWLRQIYSAEADELEYGNAVVVDEHNVFVTGQLAGNESGNTATSVRIGTFLGDFNGATTAFVGAFSKLGDFRGAKLLETPASSRAKGLDLAHDSDNDRLYLLGEVEGTLVTDTATLTATSPKTFFVAYELNSIANQVNFRERQATSLADIQPVSDSQKEDVFNAMVMGENGEVWLGIGYGTELLSTTGLLPGMAILKGAINTQGDVDFTEYESFSLDGSGYQEAQIGGLTFEDEKLYVTGYYLGTFDPAIVISGNSSVPAPQKNLFVMSLSVRGQGSVEWFKTHTSTNASFGYAIEVDDKDERYIVAGAYKGTFGTLTSAAQKRDGLVLVGSTDDGNMALSYSVTGKGDDHVRGLAIKREQDGTATADVRLVGTYAANHPLLETPVNRGFLGLNPLAGLNGLFIQRVQLAHRNIQVPVQLNMDSIFDENISAGTRRFKQLELGADHACVLLPANVGSFVGDDDPCDLNSMGHASSNASRRIWCWGKNNRKQSGPIGSCALTGKQWPPMPVRLLKDTIGSAPYVDHFTEKLFLGMNHSCAYVEDTTNSMSPLRQVHCWGDTAVGQGGMEINETPQIQVIDPVTNSVVTAIYDNLAMNETLLVGSGPSANHSVIARASSATNTSTLACWGEYRQGQLEPQAWPYRNMGADYSPTDINDEQDEFKGRSETYASALAQVATGDGYTCMLKDALTNTNLYCWGDSSSGKLGRSPAGAPVSLAHDKYQSIDHVAFTNVSSFTSHFELGRMHGCAFMNNGQVYCWGNNEYGQIATSTTNISFNNAHLIDNFRQ